MNWTLLSLLLLLLFSSTIFLVNAAKLKKRGDDVETGGSEGTEEIEDVGDDYSDFSSQPVKNGGAHLDLKTVTYSTIAPKLEIPTRSPQLLNASNKMNTKSSQMRVAQPRPVPQYNRGYYFQHYPWDRLPRRYLMRPGMTYVYPTQYQFAQYRYPYLDQKDPYNIYRSHPGIGGGCGGGYGGGCGGGYGGGYQNYGGGCGGGRGGGGCSEDFGSEEEDDSYEDEEGGKSGEAKINKKDPLEDLELEDLEKLSKTSEDTKTSDSEVETTDEVVTQSKSKKISKDDKDYDLIDDRKKFLVKWL